MTRSTLPGVHEPGDDEPAIAIDLVLQSADGEEYVLVLVENERWDLPGVIDRLAERIDLCVSYVLGGQLTAAFPASAGKPRPPSELKREVARDQACEYIETSGTSMAAPHVSGVVAAFLSVRREFIGQLTAAFPASAGKQVRVHVDHLEPLDTDVEAFFLGVTDALERQGLTFSAELLERPPTEREQPE